MKAGACPMSSGPEIKLSLLRGICAGTKDFQRLKSYHVTNPMWSDGERKEKKGIIVVEAHKPNHNLNSMTSTPSASSLLLFIVSPSLSVCTDNCLQRCQLAKATQMRRKKVSARSNPGELEKRATEVPLSLFVPVQQPCFLMKMSRWMRALDARSNPV